MAEMLFDIEYLDANFLGEFLRDWFFKKPADGSWSFGCYSTFEVRSDAIEASPGLVRAFFEQEWQEELSFYGYLCRAGTMVVGCFWYWDGDGDLSFVISDKGKVFRTIRNDDCKKAYNWEDKKGE